MRTAWSQYSLATRGGTSAAAATRRPATQRSWTIGKIAWSLA